MWLRMTVALSLILTTACENERRAVSVVFVDENCIKRRFTMVEGEGVSVSTYEADGRLTPTTHFETLDEAKEAYPSATKASNCPDNIKVTAEDLRNRHPVPAITQDGGADIAD